MNNPNNQYSPPVGAYVHETTQYLQDTEQSEGINAPIAGLSQWIQPARHEPEPPSGMQEARFPSTTYEPTYSTPSYNTAEYDMSMYMAGMSEYMQDTDDLVSNGGDTWLCNTPMPAYTPEMPSTDGETQGMGPLANNNSMLMYGAPTGSYNEPGYTMPTYGELEYSRPIYNEPEYTRPTPVTPGDTQSMFMPVSQALPDNTQLYSIPGVTQGQLVFNSNMMPYDVSMSVDIASAYDAPLYTGPVPNAQGDMQDMGQLIPTSVAGPSGTNQPALSMSWPREDPEPVEPSSGPMRENRRQRRRKTGSKTKKSKDRRAAADPSTDSQSVNGSGMALALFLSKRNKQADTDAHRLINERRRTRRP
ncbi:hypothetical protein CERSUDRAFT_98426 [Gelatoporia subvermispora B]|uniref:Uncharacterized protein n=1 Tax=Ceriporiopsis subvermispora (strain B) TaxID=914234 RepID=M2Q8W5_CERS8|nr:hypothetical protein CERSUDRAFT_98426 [Gelatoporia subvermispora B]